MDISSHRTNKQTNTAENNTSALAKEEVIMIYNLGAKTAILKD